MAVRSGIHSIGRSDLEANEKGLGAAPHPPRLSIMDLCTGF